MADLLLNNVDATSYGFYLARTPGIKPGLNAVPQTSRVPGRAGLRKTVSIWDDEPRQFTLEGDLQGATTGDARTKLDTLLAILGVGATQLVFGDYPSRYLTAEFLGVSVAAYGPEQVATRLALQIQMVATDPFFYDTAETVVTTTTAFASLALGTGVVRPQLKVTGAATNPSIIVRDRNNVTISTITFSSYSLGAGATVIIDVNNMTVLEGSTNRIDKCSALSFPVLDPRACAKYESSLWPSANVSSGTLEVRYRKAWR